MKKQQETATAQPDVLQSLLGGIEVATTKLDQSRQANSASMWKELLGDLDAKADSQAKEETGDADQLAKISQRIKGASFATLQKSIDQEELDLTECMAQLEVILQGIGMEYVSYREQTPEQKNRLAASKQAIVDAQQQVGVAGTKWFGKEKAIAKAKQAVVDAETAAARLEETVKKEMRSRLAHASIEEKLSAFKTSSAKTYDVLSERVKEITSKLQIVAKYRTQVAGILQQATTKREELDGQIDQKTAEARNEEAKLASLTNGTKAYAEQQNKVSDLSAEIALLTGNRNTCLAVQQDKSLSAQRLLEIQQALIKQLTNHNTYRALLKSQMDDDSVSLDGTLTLMKGSSDEDAAKNIATTARGINARMDVIVAEASAASDDAIVGLFEDFEGYLKRFLTTKGASDEAHAAVTSRMMVIKADIKDNYGIDMEELMAKKYPTGGQPE